MKCPECGYQNPSVGTKDNKCDECGHLLLLGSSLRASESKRLVNLIGDILIFRLLVSLFVIHFVNTDFIQMLAADPIKDWLFGIFLLFLYYCVFEVLFQRTPAKFITRTKVVTQDGKRPTFTNILGRTLCRFIPFEAFTFLGNHPTGLHHLGP